MFIDLITKNPEVYFSWVLVVMFSICLHELAHAYTALKLGDDTAADAGHLTLNPLVQMGPMSMVILCIIGIAWGAVPVTPSRLRGRAGYAVVAFAGPAANIVLAFIFAFLVAIIPLLPIGAAQAQFVHDFVSLGAMTNVVLFIFNLIPIPMLDGWTVFSHFFPAMNRISPETASMITWGVFMAVFITPLGQLMWSLGSSGADQFVHFWQFALGFML